MFYRRRGRQKIEKRLTSIIDSETAEIIPLQFLQAEDFKKRIDQLSKQYSIKAIIGTVPIEHQNIPYFPAYDAFDDEKMDLIKKHLEEELPVEQISRSLTGTLKQVGSVKDLILRLQKILQQLEIELSVGIPAGVKTGMVLHLAFLCESLKTNAHSRSFPDLEAYEKQHRLELNTVETVLMPLEKHYNISIPKDELAYIVQMIVENQLKLKS